MCRNLFSGFLFILIAPLALSQPVTEHAVSTPVYSAAESDQIEPLVASNGTEYLAAWMDSRGFPEAIYATRISARGEVLDPTGIRIPMRADMANRHMVAVLWVKDAYVVVFSYDLLNMPLERFFTEVARIDSNGKLIDGPRVVFDAPGISRAAATNGTRIVLTYSDKVALLDDRGELIERDIQIPQRPPSGDCAASSNGSRFLLGCKYRDPRWDNSLSFFALDANGTFTNESCVIAPAPAIGNGPVLGSDGNDYIAIYVDARTGKTATAHISSTAQLLDSTALDFQDVNFEAYTAGVVWTGSAYLVAAAGTAKQSFDGIRLDRTGRAIDKTPFALGLSGTPGSGIYPSLVWNGRSVLVALSTGSWLMPSGIDVTAQLLSASGTALGSPVVMASANAQTVPSLATGGKYDLAVWSERSAIYASRISSSGQALDGRGITVAAEPYRSPKVLFDAGSYVVAWTGEHGELKLQRVDGDTGSLREGTIAHPECIRSFDIERDAAGLVLFASTCGDLSLIAQRVTTTGATSGTVPISPPEMLTGNPRAAWNGTEWLVTWNKLIPYPFGPPGYWASVYAERLSASLNPIDSAALRIDDSNAQTTSPVVASDGSDFLIVWSRPWSTTDPHGTFARRVRADGSFGDAPEPGIQLETGIGSLPQSVIWDGNAYAIAITVSHGDLKQIDVTHVSRAAGVASGELVAVSPEGVDAPQADLVALAPGGVRVIYSRTALEAPYSGVRRAFTRDAIFGRHHASPPR